MCQVSEDWQEKIKDKRSQTFDFVTGMFYFISGTDARQLSSNMKVGGPPMWQRNFRKHFLNYFMNTEKKTVNVTTADVVHTITLHTSEATHTVSQITCLQILCFGLLLLFYAWALMVAKCPRILSTYIIGLIKAVHENEIRCSVQPKQSRCLLNIFLFSSQTMDKHATLARIQRIQPSSIQVHTPWV